MAQRALLSDVWGAAYEHAIQVPRVHLANERGKIEGAHSPRQIITDPAVACRFTHEQGEQSRERSAP
jgi:hypothetical protein